MLLNSLYIQETKGKGRGVFTENYIEAGTIIEIAPVLVFSLNDTLLIKQTSLYDYYFMWSEIEEIAAIALVYGSIYNHSYSPNANVLMPTPGDTTTATCVDEDFPPAVIV